MLYVQLTTFAVSCGFAFCACGNNFKSSLVRIQAHCKSRTHPFRLFQSFIRELGLDHFVLVCNLCLFFDILLWSTMFRYAVVGALFLLDLSIVAIAGGRGFIKLPSEAHRFFGGSAEGNDDSVGTKWAVLLAGSSGYWNYRHQVISKFNPLNSPVLLSQIAIAFLLSSNPLRKYKTNLSLWFLESIAVLIFYTDIIDRNSMFVFVLMFIWKLDYEWSTVIQFPFKLLMVFVIFSVCLVHCCVSLNDYITAYCVVCVSEFILIPSLISERLISNIFY